MKYKITIPEPCHENWAEMTPTERGRYCKVCQKEVSDFTKMSNFDLVWRLDRGEKVCGRFRKDQLDVELDSLKDVSYLGRIAIFLGLTSLVSVTMQSAQAQQTNNVPTEFADTITKLQKKQLVAMKSEDVVTIRGRVFLDTIDFENTLPGVIVAYETKTDTISTVTNIDGEFCLEIPEKEFDSDIELSFHSLGSESHICLVDKNTPYFEVVLESSFLGEVVMETRLTLWQRFKNLFRRKHKE